MATFEQAGKATQEIFNKLGKIPDFGVPAIRVMVQGNWETDNTGNERLLVAALNLIFTNGCTRDDWLKNSLQTSTGKFIDQKWAIGINRFLAGQGIVNVRPEMVPFRNEKGQIEERKVWTLTDKYQKLVDSMPVKEKREIRNVGVERVVPVSKNGNNIGDARDVLDKMDNTALMFDRQTQRFCQIGLLETNKLTNRDERMSRRDDISRIGKVFADQSYKPFHLSHQYDFRGRMSALGGVITTQGHEVLKACVKFAEPESKCDKEEIYIYAGRELGCKGTFQEAEILGRLGSADSLILKSLVADPTRTAVKLDGCCNGIQWISSLIGIEEAARLTNVIGHEPNDFYTAFKNRFNLKDRQQAKDFVMPFGYGAGRKKLIETTMLPPKRIDDILKEFFKWLPIEDFFTYLKSCADLAVTVMGVTEFKWTMPDGFEVVHKYTESQVLNEGTFSVRVGEETTVEWRMASALPPNIIHSIDAYFLREVVRKCPFPVITVHDSFGCHSSNVKQLRKILVETFREVIEADILNNIMDQLGFEHNWKTIDPKLIVNPYMFM